MDIADDGTLALIAAKLGKYRTDAPKVFKNAVNATATEVRRLLADEAHNTYTVRTVSFNKQIRIGRAGVHRPVATLFSSGHMLNLADFDLIPKKPVHPSQRPACWMGRVLTGGSRKPLIFDGHKAFVVKFRNGKISAVHRDGTRTRTGREMLNALFAPSVPQMLGGEERVFGAVQPKIMDLLNSNIDKQIAKVLERNR